MGCARMGGDECVVFFRKGRNARSFEIKSWGKKAFLYASEEKLLHKYFLCYDPSAVVIDGSGVGGPVFDELRNDGYRIHEVIGQGKADDSVRYGNRRAELWDLGKERLRTGVLIKVKDERPFKLKSSCSPLTM